MRLSTLQWTLSEEKPKARGLRRSGLGPATSVTRCPCLPHRMLFPDTRSPRPHALWGLRSPFPRPGVSAFPAVSFWAEAGHWLSPRICFGYRLSPPSRVAADNQRSRPDLGHPAPGTQSIFPERDNIHQERCRSLFFPKTKSLKTLEPCRLPGNEDGPSRRRDSPPSASILTPFLLTF